MTQIDITISIILAVALFAASLIITLQYGLFSRWWDHRTGVGLFTTLASLALVTGMSASQWFFPLNLHWAWVGYVLLISALLSMWVIITREQIAGARRRRARRRKLENSNRTSNP